MNEYERDFLLASAELVRRQQEVLPLLARHLGVLPNELYYLWMGAMGKERTESLQWGNITGTNWQYFFHGMECDLSNPIEDLFVSVDFGPRGRLDTFTGWGILQFVMVSKSPWKSFPALRAYLAEKPPPYHHLSGSHSKMCLLLDSLIELGMYDVADRNLQDLREQHTEGNRILLPDDLDIRTVVDTHVCSRLTLSDAALTLLASLTDESSLKPENMA